MKKAFSLILILFSFSLAHAASAALADTTSDNVVLLANGTSSSTSSPPAPVKRLEIEYPEVPGSGYPTIPGAPKITPSTTLPEYILYLFWFALAVLGIVAFSAFIYAGVLWLTAAGNASQVQRAKEIFVNVFLGVILILGAYLLFQLLNPELLFLKTPDIAQIAIVNAPICVPTVKNIQETCQQRGSAWVACTPAQAAEAQCSNNDQNGDGLPDEICCRRLPGGKLAQFCPTDLGGTPVSSCADYRSSADELISQGVPLLNSDLNSWCDLDTCRTGNVCYTAFSNIVPVLGFRLNDEITCRPFEKPNWLNKCQDYIEFLARPDKVVPWPTAKNICERDPFGVGPCRYSGPTDPGVLENTFLQLFGLNRPICSPKN